MDTDHHGAVEKEIENIPYFKMMVAKEKISVVIPAFNEEANVEILAEKLCKTLDNLPFDYEIIFVDDGSTDRTLEKIQAMASRMENLYFIELSRNFGGQYALKAGLDNAKGDAVISMDCDMQHPVSLLPQIISTWKQGYDMVYTIRKETKKISRFKKITSKWFYRIFNAIVNIPLEPGTADFRLIDKKVIQILRGINENDLFLRGMINWMGFKKKGITFVAGARYAGQSKYSLIKLVKLALHAVLSMTIRPLYFATYIGITLSFLSLLYIPYVAYSYFKGIAVSGWVSLIISITFIGGVQLFILGIMGIYIGKLYMQVKNRPSYIIRNTNIGEV